MYLAFQTANAPSLWLPSITQQPVSSLVARTVLMQLVSQFEQPRCGVGGAVASLLNADGRLLLVSKNVAAGPGPARGLAAGSTGRDLTGRRAGEPAQAECKLEPTMKLGGRG